MTHPEVGKRDAKHRKFVGYGVRCSLDRGSGLSEDGYWHDRHHRAFWCVWESHGVPVAKARELSKHYPRVRIVRVYRPENKTRRVLRELVEAIGGGCSMFSCDDPPACSQCVAREAAEKLLGLT